MQVREINVSEIKEYAKNAKRHPDEQVSAIANSIEKFGFRQPLVLDKNMEIVIGHGRFAAAKSLGMSVVPCIMADDLTEDQIKALRIADNKTNESSWDFDLLGEELAQLVDIDMTDLGFNEAEILELQIDDSPEEDFDRSQSPELHDRPAIDVAPGIAQIPKYIEQPAYGNGEAFHAEPPIMREELAAYAQKAESLVTRRVIIVYRTSEEEAYLKDMLHVSQENQLNVVFDAKNLMLGGAKDAESAE